MLCVKIEKANRKHTAYPKASKAVKDAQHTPKASKDC